MGRQIITQRRGRGTPTYKAHSHRWKIAIKYRNYDELEKTGILNGKIIDIFHNPGFNAPLAKILFENGEMNHIIAPLNMKVYDAVSVGAQAPVKIGNTLPLKNIPEGTDIYNIENLPADGGSFVRSAGGTAKVIMNASNKVTVMLPSKKQHEFDPMCRATIGTVAGAGKRDKPFVKAGKMHHHMRAHGKLYPRTSGVAMNAVDHPFGSGRGRHIGKPKTVSRFAPPGRKVGLVGARKTGRGR
ncbi:MAG TPA: 50S ribosomal protein L2 [Candidatus Nanoarchaeia archaeon]|nr:50S ribosomal protein L2 [Candidatus Nanoarchaeia archaeon]